jgi:hypothetical protein
MPAAAGITTGHFDDDTDLDLAITNFNGGASILLGVSDFAPPTTTIARTPAQPDGANGWYVSAVGVTISADDGANGSGVVETRCDVLGPLAPVPTFDGLSAECAVSGVSVDGEHMVYAASVDALENEESPVASVSVKIDTTPPSVVPAVAGPGPVFKLDGAGSNVVANVTDATSGALAASVFGAADLSSVGNKSLLLVGSDRAGNTSTVVCPYRVSYRVIGVAPTSAVLFRGSTVPIQFRLANAAGTRISDSEAVDLISPTCKVKITLNGVAAPGCAIYKLVSDVFEYGLYLPYSLSPGAYRLGIRVNAPDGSGVVNTESVTVVIW